MYLWCYSSQVLLIVVIHKFELLTKKKVTKKKGSNSSSFNKENAKSKSKGWCSIIVNQLFKASRHQQPIRVNRT